MRNAIIAVLAGAAVILGAWALSARPWHQLTGDEVAQRLSPAQKKAYQEGFDLCYQRVMANAHPQGDEEWNATLRRFDACTASLSTPVKTTWEPWENKWRWELLPPPQGFH